MVGVLANLNLLGREWDLHAMIAGAMLAIAGVQAVALGLVARAYGVHHLGEHDPLFERCDGASARARPARRARRSCSPGSDRQS